MNVDENDSENDDDDIEDKKDVPMFIHSKLSFGKCSIASSILVDTGALSNIISVSAISRLPRLPKIKKEDTILTGANKKQLHCIGSTNLLVTLGDSEKLVKFYIVEDLATTAILGRRSIKNLKGKIDVAAQTIKFGPDAPIKLIFPDKQINVKVSKTIKLKPGDHTTISCKATEKLQVRGTHMLISNSMYHRHIMDQIVDTFSGKMDVFVTNDSGKEITIQRGSIIASIKPYDTTQTSLMVLDEDTINDLLCDTTMEDCFLVQSGKPKINNKKSKSKSKGKTRKKPQFVRPIELHSNLSDEEIIDQQLNYNKGLLSEAQQQRLRNVIIKNKAAFSLRSEIGRSKSVKCKIRLQPDATGCYRQPFRLSDFELSLMKTTISNLVKMGVLQKAENGKFIRFCSACLLVAKSDQSCRLTVDFRSLNKQIKPEHFSYPRIDDILCRIGKNQSKIFGSFDLSDSFHQVGITEDSKDLTAFSPWPGAIYTYNVLPQGLKVSSGALSKLMTSLIGDLEFLENYADDVTCHSLDIDSHIDNVDIFLQRIISDNLKLNLRKCMLLDNKCSFLGSIVKDGTCTPLPKHIDSILKMPTPTDKSQVRSLLGALQWLSKYVKNFSAKTGNLSKLLHKSVPFSWNSDHQQTFEAIKKELTEKPVLHLPTGAGMYDMFCDSSDLGHGVILLETVKGETHVVGYASRTLMKSEHRLSTCEKELSAIAFGLNHFRNLLYRPELINVHTDHASIVHILKGKTPTATKRLANLVSQINSYHYAIFHLPGKLNDFADYLSRLPYATEQKPIYTHESTELTELSKATEMVGMQNTSTQPVRRSSRVSKKPDFYGKRVEYTQGNSAHTDNVTSKTNTQQSSSQVRKRGRPRKHISANTGDDTSKSLSNGIIDKSHAENDRLTESIVDNYNAQETGHELPFLSDIIPEPIPVIPKQSDYDTTVDVSLDKQRTERRSSEKKYLPQRLGRDFHKHSQIIFSDSFHGSVPAKTRSKLRSLALKNYDAQIKIEDVIQEQRTDPYLRDIITYLEHRVLPQNKIHAKRIQSLEDHFIMIGKVLFRLPRPQDVENEYKLRIQLAIPDSLADIIIRQKHERFFSLSHAGYLRCLLSIKKKYFIHNLANRLKNIISTCGLCNKLRNPNMTKVKQPMRISKAKSCSKPWQMLNLDHFELKSSKYTSKHVLLIVDEFTSYTFLRPCNSTSAEEVAGHLNILFRQLGIPTFGLVSDRGSSFTGKVAQILEKHYKFTWPHGLSQMPVGSVENRVKIAKTVIKYASLLDENLDPYDCLLDCSYAINNTASVVNGLTPFECFYGWSTNDITDVNLSSDLHLPNNLVIYEEELKNQANRRHALIKKARELKSSNMKWAADRTISHLPQYQVGDLCLLRTHNHPLSSKTSRKMKVLKKGPFRIQAIDGMHCVLVDMENKVYNDLVPLRHIETIPGYVDNFPIDLCNQINEKPADWDEDCEDEYFSADEDNIDDVHINDNILCFMCFDDSCVNSVLSDTQYPCFSNPAGMEMSKVQECAFMISSKTTCRNGIDQRLIYPFSLKRSGTWIPDSYLAR